MSIREDSWITLPPFLHSYQFEKIHGWLIQPPLISTYRIRVESEMSYTSKDPCKRHSLPESHSHIDVEQQLLVGVGRLHATAILEVIRQAGLGKDAEAGQYRVGDTCIDICA